MILGAAARAVNRWPRAVLVTTALFVVVAPTVSLGLFDQLSAGGFEDPSAESTEAVHILDEQFDTGVPGIVVLVTARSGDVDSPEVVAAGTDLTELLSERDDLDDVAGYWSFGGIDILRSTARDRALVVARARGDDDEQQDVTRSVTEQLEAWGDRTESVDIVVSGERSIYLEVADTIESDLLRAEAIAIPATGVLLVIIFGGVVAALLPLAVGVVAAVGGIFVLWLIASATDVSLFSINLLTAMSLGLSIDYSLFMVSRFREELGSGASVEEATDRTVRFAGRTVAFSALTVAVSLSALLVFPLFFLKSFAYAGIGVIVVAMVASILTLPALLRVLGTRVDSARLWRQRPQPPEGSGWWYGVAQTVMNRPVLFTVVITGVLIVLGLPFLRVQFGVPDENVLPEGNKVRVALETIDSEFDFSEVNAFPVVLPRLSDDAELDAYAQEASRVDGVARVDTLTGSYQDGTRSGEPDVLSLRFAAEEGGWVSVVPSVHPITREAEVMVADLRAIDAGSPTYVGGRSAALVDSKAAIFDRVPLAGLIIATATFLLLLFAFRSVLVPLKAIVLNLLSLTATFGMLVWVFQDGNGADVLGFTATGLTDTTVPILMFCIAFGLSMDYEVFLISRIREEYDRTGDNETAIAVGLQRTGRIITAAAAVLAVTFVAFATSQVTFIKMFGLGLALAVLVDSSIVRVLLVPALMKLAGPANWWAPRFLRRRRSQEVVE